jgi:hypothetical protein
MRLIMILLVLVLALPAEGQQRSDFRYHDSLTYSMYLEKRWSELTDAGTDALKAGHDFYYMRMRIGIAWFERGRYAGAAHHFRRALEHNSGDAVALEYLYYCNLYSGEYGTASRLIASLGKEHGKKVQAESGLARNTVTLSAYYNGFDTDAFVENPSVWFSDTEPGSETVAKSIVNPSVSMSHNISPGVYYIHSFNNVTKTSLLHYYDGTRVVNLNNQKVFQNQYYGSFSISSGGGFTFRPYLHGVVTVYDYILPLTGMSSGFYTVMRATAFHYSAGVNLRKRAGYFAVDGGVAVNKFGNGRALQGEAGLTIYPLGNSNFYLGGRIAGVLQPEMTLSDVSSVKPVYAITAGISIPKAATAEFSFIAGEFRNFTTGNGLYLFNSPDFITERILVNFTIPLGNKAGTALFIGGGLNRHRSVWYSAANIYSENQILNYKSFNLNGGVLWNF